MEYNCNLRKKEEFKLTMPDETVVLLKSPSRNITQKLTKVQSDFSKINQDNIDVEIAQGVFESAYEVMTEAINNNQSGYKTTAKSLKEMFNDYEIIDLFTAYVTFVIKKVNNSKN